VLPTLLAWSWQLRAIRKWAQQQQRQQQEQRQQERRQQERRQQERRQQELEGDQAECESESDSSLEGAWEAELQRSQYAWLCQPAMELAGTVSWPVLTVLAALAGYVAATLLEAG